MSTVIVKFNPELEKVILSPIKDQLIQEIIEVSAQVLKKQNSDIIVDFESWGNPKPQNAPDILFRAETSVARRPLLKEWGIELVQTYKELAKNLNIPPGTKLRIVAKPYVIDSEWVEDR